MIRIYGLFLIIICSIICLEAIPYHDGTNHGHPPSENEEPTLASQFIVEPDNRTLDELYQAALAEDGPLVVYAGGDIPGGQDANKEAFEAQFPGVKIEIIVDLSKYHDARIDYQLQTDTLVVDVAHLQTLQDFPRWKAQGALLNYKTIDWDHIYPQFKDLDGAFTGILPIAFSNNINTELLPNEEDWPIEARDYLRPELKGKIVFTYPHDDDAVLFWFKQQVDKYGFEYLDELKAQEPFLVRGTRAARDLVQNGTYVATMSASGSLIDIPNLPKFELSKEDKFVLWVQRAAIFQKAKHPETAKLYLSWLVDKTVVENRQSWSVRDDVVPPGPYKSIFDYPNADPLVFESFMANREQVEILKTQMQLLFGPVEGPSPTGDLGLHPTQAIPHY